MGRVTNHAVIRNMKHLKDKMKIDGLNFSIATETKEMRRVNVEMKHQYSYYSVHQHRVTRFHYAMSNSEE